MSNSLQDQLRALGLAKEKPKKAKKKARRSGGKKQRRESISLQKAWALKEREERNQADHARRQKQAEDRKRREINRQIRAIVDRERLNDPGAEIARHFVFRGRIRKIDVTPSQLEELNAGKLGVVYLSGSYHLLAQQHVDAVRSISGGHVPDLGSDSADDGDHPVPDDLTW